MAAALDWKLFYAAPAEFTFAAPWWLLLDRPESWDAGLDDWDTLFDKRLKSFFIAMVKSENIEIEKGTLKEEQRLSGPMQQGWESGDFLIGYGTKNLPDASFGPVPVVGHSLR